MLVLCNHPARLQQAHQLAERLHLPLLQDLSVRHLQAPEFVLLFDELGLSLQQTGKKAPGPIRVDFTAGAVDHRRRQGGGKGQMIAKACGLKSVATDRHLRVLDMTAGLGRDGFVLASLGCEVVLNERSALVHALLADGLTRGRDYAVDSDPELAAILARVQLLPLADSRIEALPSADIVYLDPMFPGRDKSADVKKEMRAFHTVVGQDLDADELLERALALAEYRVVVKRPRKAPFLNQQPPSYQLEGKSSRYDIYTKKKLG